MTRAAAFFDLDKTLMEGSSGIWFARAAYRRGLMSRGQLAKDLWSNVRFRLRGSTDEATEIVRQRVLGAVAGWRVVDLERLTPEVLAGILPRVYPQMLEVAWGHQDAGRKALIVTAASQELAELLAKVLLLDGAVGMRVEQRDGFYTGQPGGPFTYREGKAQALREIAERDGIDLSASYAYSDSESDLPMLRCVGHAVVVNPDPELRRIARAEGWQIMHLDKLGRRLRVVLGVAALAALAGGTGFVADARLRSRSTVRRAARRASPR